MNSIALKEGVADMLSFMYQFMFVPPTEKMQLMVTNGRLSYHNYVVVGEEILTTKNRRTEYTAYSGAQYGRGCKNRVMAGQGLL